MPTPGASTRSRVMLAPSILDADLAHLGKALDQLASGDADFVHLDVMDGHFVPNISIGLPVVASVKRATALPLDVHLMISQPERYLESFIAAGADILTVHYEATPHPHRALQMIRDTGVRAGLALNPGTPIGSTRDLLPYCDLVLVMSVNPGFGGQSFIPETHRRIRELRGMLDTDGLDALIEVDGGVSASNAAAVFESGATVLVSGSAVFKHDLGVEAALSELRNAITP